MRASLRRATASDSGFTLIELMVVIIIIGLLAAIAVPVYMNQRRAAELASAGAAARGLGMALEEVISDPVELAQIPYNAWNLGCAKMYHFGYFANSIWMGGQVYTAGSQLSPADKAMLARIGWYLPAEDKFIFQKDPKRFEDLGIHVQVIGPYSPTVGCAFPATSVDTNHVTVQIRFQDEWVGQALAHYDVDGDGQLLSATPGIGFGHEFTNYYADAIEGRYEIGFDSAVYDNKRGGLIYLKKGTNGPNA